MIPHTVYDKDKNPVGFIEKLKKGHYHICDRNGYHAYFRGDQKEAEQYLRDNEIPEDMAEYYRPEHAF